MSMSLDSKSFQARWVFATTVGFTAAAAIRIGLPRHSWTAALLVGVVQGCLLGASQWLVLRSLIPDARRWIAATSAGFALMLGAYFFADAAGFVGELQFERFPGVAWLLRAAALAMPLGLLQWFVLRALPRSPLWTPVVMASYSLAAGVSAFLQVGGIAAVQHLPGPIFTLVADGVVPGSLLGVFTATPLVWIASGKSLRPLLSRLFPPSTRRNRA